jgi:hypothetical protein
MTGNCNNRNGAQAGSFLHLGSQCSYNRSRLCHDAELIPINTQGSQNISIQIASGWIKHLRSRGYRIFADGLACKHIYKGIRNEQNLIGGIQDRTAVSLHSI